MTRNPKPTTEIALLEPECSNPEWYALAAFLARWRSYRDAEQEGLLERSPAAHVRRPRLDYESHATGLDRNELGALLVAAGLGVVTLTVLRKGRKIVTVPLAPRTARALDLAIGERVQGPIFLGRNGERLDCHAAWRIVRRLARKAGINKPIGRHTLRHAFITAALDVGVPLRDVQEAASHADPRTTMRYDRGRVSLDRHATHVVAAFVAGAARQPTPDLISPGSAADATEVAAGNVVEDASPATNSRSSATAVAATHLVWITSRSASDRSSWWRRNSPHPAAPPRSAARSRSRTTRLSSDRR